MLTEAGGVMAGWMRGLCFVGLLLFCHYLVEKKYESDAFWLLLFLGLALVAGHC